MYSITKEFSFEAAHRLIMHPWKCFHLHGHSYKVFVTLTGPLQDTAMVKDFADLKWIKLWLDEHRDHGYIHHPDDPLREHCAELWLKCFDLWCEPTAEAMAWFLFTLIWQQEVLLSKVVLFETASSSACVEK
jgi:6-pyruvoyltetrahydropterin/6-carboxytetrahydropterin synthase